MMLHIQVDPPYKNFIQPADLRQAAKQVLQTLKVKEALDLSLVVSSDEKIQKLNKKFMRNDTPTDVLSFPSGEIDPLTAKKYLGDIIISYPRAQEQALQAGCEVKNELSLLVVHGMLHLFGYDHGTREQKNAMWAMQSQILQELGISPQDLPE